MKNDQKLELFAGLAILPAALLNFYFTTYLYFKKFRPKNVWSVETISLELLYFLLPALLIATGSVLHSSRNNAFGFIMIILGGCWVAFFSLMPGIIGSSYNGYPVIGGLPGLLAIITIMIALYRVLRTEDRSFS